MVRNVRIFNRRDSLLYGGYPTDSGKSAQPSIEHQWGTLHFEYSSPLFGQQTSLEYSCRLRGFDDNWSEWSAKTEKEYTHLPAGSYHFEVKVRNNLGNESAPHIYSFRILPPWYQTLWAYLIYFLIGCVGIFYLYKWQKKKFYLQQEKYEEEQKQLQYLHQLEINHPRMNWWPCGMKNSRPKWILKIRNWPPMPCTGAERRIAQQDQG